LWYRGGKFCFKVVLYLLYRVRPYNKDNFPKKGPVLLLCNHQSFLDPIFCQLPIIRTIHCVARDTLFENKITGPLLKKIYAIPIKRGRADLASMRRIMSVLKDGGAVCLFPEGTRTSDGRILDIKAGFSLLSRKTGAKVVPVIVDGAFECWPRHKKLPRLFGKIGISYGEPILPEDIKGLTDDEFAKIIKGRLIKLQGECRKKLKKEPYDYSNS
jgi:1-acyl-sn-glycerol-3-phosphate acyltransferase